MLNLLIPFKWKGTENDENSRKNVFVHNSGCGNLRRAGQRRGARLSEEQAENAQKQTARKALAEEQERHIAVDPVWVNTPPSSGGGGGGSSSTPSSVVRLTMISGLSEPMGLCWFYCGKGNHGQCPWLKKGYAYE